MSETIDLVDGIYGAGLGDRAWPAVLNRMCDQLRARDVSLYSAAADDQLLTRAVSGLVGDDVNRTYLEDYAHRDVQMLRLLESNGPGSLTGDDLLADGELATCPVHEGFLTPNELCHQVVWYFATDDGERHTFAFSRRRRQTPFGRAEVRAMMAYAGYVRRALNLAERMRAAARDEYAEALGEAGIGVFVQATLTGLQAANSAARHLAEEGHALRAVRQVAGKQARRPGRHTIATPLGTLDLEIVLRGRRRFVFTRLSRRPNEAELRERFDFTPAEAGLAKALADGVSLANYAVARRVSVHTVRNQLRAVFAKAGVSSQKDLVAAVLSGAAA